MSTLPTQLRFGDSHAVRQWEDEIQIKERAEALRDEGLIVLTEDQAETITRQIDSIMDTDSFTPDPGDILRPMYDLIFDEEQEPLPGMEKFAEVYTVMQNRFHNSLNVIYEIVLP